MSDDIYATLSFLGWLFLLVFYTFHSLGTLKDHLVTKSRGVISPVRRTPGKYEFPAISSHCIYPLIERPIGKALDFVFPLNRRVDLLIDCVYASNSCLKAIIKTR